MCRVATETITVVALSVELVSWLSLLKVESETLSIGIYIESWPPKGEHRSRSPKQLFVFISLSLLQTARLSPAETL